MIGRDQEMARLRALLETERVVALVGPSGVGKTTIARACVDPDESLFLDCFGIAPGELPARIAAAVHASEVHQPRLLVLDNWPGGAVPPEDLFSGRVLITTHVPPPACVTLVVTPFAVPDRHNLEASSAFRLFQAVAERTVVGSSEHIDFGAALNVIGSLGGHPLGIAIAARHAAVFGAQEVARLLDEGVELEDPSRDPRQQTLERSLEFSWQQLTEPQRRALFALASFQRPIRVTSLADVLEQGVAETMTVLGELARAGVIAPGPYPRPLELWVDVSLRGLENEDPESASHIRDRIYALALDSAPERFQADPGEIGDGPSFWEAAILHGIEGRARDGNIKIVLALLGWSMSFGRQRYEENDYLVDVVASLRSTRAHILRAKFLSWNSSALTAAIDAAWECATTDEERALVELERASGASQRLDLRATLDHIAAARRHHDSARAKTVEAWFQAFVDSSATQALVVDLLADATATDRMRAAIGPAATWTAPPDRRVAVAREFLERASGFGDLEVTMIRVLADALDYDGRREEAAQIRESGRALSKGIGYDRMAESLAAEAMFSRFGGPDHPTLDELRTVRFETIHPDVRARIASAIAVQACVDGVPHIAAEVAAHLGHSRLSLPPSAPFEGVAELALAVATGDRPANVDVYGEQMLRVLDARDDSESAQLALLEGIQRLALDHSYAGRLAFHWIQHHLPPFTRRVSNLDTSTADVVILSDFRTFRASSAWHQVPEVTGAVLRTLATGQVRDFEAIAAEVWPQESIDWEALQNRVNVRVAALRKCGLRPHLVKTQEGFVLHGRVQIEPS